MHKLYVNYDNIASRVLPQIENPKYAYNYDDRTTIYYKTLRHTKTDPFTLDDIPDDIAFKFYHQWNSFNGSRLECDPFGPLYFHPDTLINYYYMNRLNGLWISENVYTNEGYYGAHVGAGNDIYIHSRGYHPDMYLFRLPVIDCYNIIDSPHLVATTYGPVITDEEIKLIDKLAAKSGKYLYGNSRPNLYYIKTLYDTALSKNPNPNNTNVSHLNVEQLQNFYDRENRQAVEKLKNL